VFLSYFLALAMKNFDATNCLTKYYEFNSRPYVVFPLPITQRLLFEKTFWRKRFFNIISEILSDYFEGKENLIFQYHNLFLSSLAETLRDKIGGKILAHLHCLAWKYNFISDNSKFNDLYKLYISEKFDDFKKLEVPPVDYKTEDGIICVSESAKQYIANILHEELKVVGIIPNGMEINLPKKFLSRKNNPVEILYVGKVNKDKGIFDFLAVLTELKQRKYDFTLKIAGAISENTKDQILKKYKNLRLEILGQCPFSELEKLYMTCTIGVVPSLFEQCSYVAIEMAMYGMPMIVSDVDALSEMFEHEKTALLNPLIFDDDFGLSCNKNKFVENLIRLIEDKSLRDNLSTNVQQMAKKDFSVNKMMDKTIEIYKHILNNE
jgi:glycosyltransferase involved in cell wall biosynthesis